MKNDNLKMITSRPSKITPFTPWKIIT
jgi:hypothetical protein